MYTPEEMKEIGKAIADELKRESHIIDSTIQYRNGPRPSGFIDKANEVLTLFGGSLAYSTQGMGGPDGSMNLRGMLFVTIESEEDEPAALEALEVAGLWRGEVGFQIDDSE